jgi:hypothetical protein
MNYHLLGCGNEAMGGVDLLESYLVKYKQIHLADATQIAKVQIICQKFRYHPITDILR